MKYSATHYARSFAALAKEARTEADEKRLVKNFWAAVEKKGDLGKTRKIIAEAQTLLRRANGHDLWEVETARKQKVSAAQLLQGIAKPKDTITELVNPELVAGVRITKNDEEQIDASLATRLNYLFPNA